MNKKVQKLIHFVIHYTRWNRWMQSLDLKVALNKFCLRHNCWAVMNVLNAMAALTYAGWNSGMQNKNHSSLLLLLSVCRSVCQPGLIWKQVKYKGKLPFRIKVDILSADSGTKDIKRFSHEAKMKAWQGSINQVQFNWLVGQSISVYISAFWEDRLWEKVLN